MPYPRHSRTATDAKLKLLRKLLRLQRKKRTAAAVAGDAEGAEAVERRMVHAQRLIAEWQSR